MRLRSDRVLLRRNGAGRTYPSRPITLMVPAAAAAATTRSRAVAERMSSLLGQQIVIENRPGAGGSLAARQVARSEPDGYTIGIGNPATLAIAPSILPNVGYDPVKDFSPVGMIAASPHIILINNFIPAQTLAEFIALAKLEPANTPSRRAAPAARRISGRNCSPAWPASSSPTCPTRAPGRRSPTCSAGMSA